MQIRCVLGRPTVVGVVLLTLLGNSAQSQPQRPRADRWEFTIVTEGDSAAQPSVTVACLPKGLSDDKFIPMHDECTISHIERERISLLYEMVCDGEKRATISGKISYGAKVVDGRMKIVEANNGVETETRRRFIYRLIGECPVLLSPSSY
jgi:hypothetical protein